MRSKPKGQVSLELIIVTAAIFALITVTFGDFFVIVDDTKAVVMAKTEVIEKLGELDSLYYVENVVIDKDVTTDTHLELKIIIKPNVTTILSSGERQNLQDKIANNTKYDSVTINFTET